MKITLEENSNLEIIGNIDNILYPIDKAARSIDLWRKVVKIYFSGCVYDSLIKNKGE